MLDQLLVWGGARAGWWGERQMRTLYAKIDATDPDWRGGDPPGVFVPHDERRAAARVKRTI